MTGEDGVLGNLPNSRPGRRSAKRDGPAGAGAKAARGSKSAGSPKAAGSAKATRASKPRRQRDRTTAVKGGRIDDGVRVDPVMRGKGGHDPAREQETPAGDPLSAAVRTAAGLAATGVKVAGAVTQELVRRLPRP
jgi:hypothetical protein